MTPLIRRSESEDKYPVVGNFQVMIGELAEKLQQHRYVTYHLRWQASTVVMTLPMLALNILGLAGWQALPIVQFIGATIFWYVDKWIFGEEQ